MTHSQAASPLSDQSVAAHSIPSFLRELWWFLGNRRWKMLFLFVIVLACSGTSFLPPWYFGKVIDALPKPGALQYTVWCAVEMVVILLFFHWLRISTKQITADLRASTCAEARQLAIDLLLAEGLKEGRLVGNEVSRLDTGLRDFAELHRIFQNEILFGIVMFAGCAAVFVVQSPSLFLSTLIYIFAFLSILRWSIPKVRDAQKTVSLARESFSGIFANVVGNALSVRASGAEDSMGRRVGSSVSELEKSEHMRNKISSRQWGALNTLNSFYLGVTLIQIGYAGATGAMSVSILVIAYSYVRELIRSVVGVMDIAEEFVQNYVGFRRLLNLLSAGEAAFSRVGSFSPGWREIRLSGVSHRYAGTASDVIHEIDWRIPRGSRFGLRGTSGAGKSTLTKVLLGLVRPSSGSVTVDDSDLFRIAPASVRAQLAIALQECEILGLSLRDNITLCRDIDEEWLRAIVDICGLSSLISRLPEGLESLVGEKGYRLSGGERQRVALARAIVRRPSMLVIDEATSMLDEQTERHFFEGLQRVLPGVTLVVISHHSRGFAYVNELFELHAGRLRRVESFQRSSSSGEHRAE